MAKLEENQAADTALVAVGAVVAVVGTLLWLGRKKPAAAATLPPGAPAPPVVSPPTVQPPLPAPPALPTAGCEVSQELLHQWGLDRNLSVFYWPTATPPTWENFSQIMQTQGLSEILASGGIGQIVIVIGDGSFWVPTGLAPTALLPAPAQRDNYCAWVQSGGEPVSIPLECNAFISQTTLEQWRVETGADARPILHIPDDQFPTLTFFTDYPSVATTGAVVVLADGSFWGINPPSLLVPVPVPVLHHDLRNNFCTWALGQ